MERICTRVVFRISSHAKAIRIGFAEAEKLADYGDMLLYMPDKKYPLRLTAANTSDIGCNDNLSKIEDIKF